MAKVLLTIQVMPKSAEVKLDAIKDAIKAQTDIGEIKEITEEAIAFGLKAVKVLTLVDDTGGVSDKIEAKLRSIKDVQEARVVDLTLV